MQAHVASQAAAAASTSHPMDTSSLNGSTAILGGGVPRVASLDFFRQLLPVNQLNVAGARPATVCIGDSRLRCYVQYHERVATLQKAFS